MSHYFVLSIFLVIYFKIFAVQPPLHLVFEVCSLSLSYLLRYKAPNDKRNTEAQETTVVLIVPSMEKSRKLTTFIQKNTSKTEKKNWKKIKYRKIAVAL